MPSKKRNCSRLNKTYKKWIKKNSKKMGGCSCQQAQPIGRLLGGGRRRSRRRPMKGGGALGPASLTDFDPGFKYTYPLNDHVNDPIAPSNITDVRMQPNMTGGGKKRSRKIRGGSSDPFLQAYNSNTLSNPPLTSMAGASIASNIVTGQSNPIMTYTDNLRTETPFI
jgi:hypothetical protein